MLSAAYQDYDALCDLVRKEIWDQSAFERLQKILNRYGSAHLREKYSGNPEAERNVLSLRLLEAFFPTKPFPKTSMKFYGTLST